MLTFPNKTNTSIIRHISDQALDKLMEARYALRFVETHNDYCHLCSFMTSLSNVMNSSLTSHQASDVIDGSHGNQFDNEPVNFLRQNTSRASAQSVQTQW